jgi:hypothetical protein
MNLIGGKLKPGNENCSCQDNDIISLDSPSEEIDNIPVIIETPAGHPLSNRLIAFVIPTNQTKGQED